MSLAATCELCGQHDEQVRVQLAWFRDPRFGPVLSTPRCMDHDACRARVLAAGDDWPLDWPVAANFMLPVPAPAELPKPEPKEPEPWFS